MKTTNHTKGTLEVRINPTTTDKEVFIAIKDANAIALLYQSNSTVNSREEAIANANRIVKAVNMHDELLQLVRELHSLLSDGMGYSSLTDKRDELKRLAPELDVLQLKTVEALNKSEL